MNHLENLVKLKKCIDSCKTQQHLSTTKRLICMQHNYIMVQYGNKIPMILVGSINSLLVSIRTKRAQLGYPNQDPFAESHHAYLQRQHHGTPEWMHTWYQQPSVAPK